MLAFGSQGQDILVSLPKQSLRLLAIYQTLLEAEPDPSTGFGQSTTL